MSAVKFKRKCASQVVQKIRYSLTFMFAQRAKQTQQKKDGDLLWSGFVEIYA